MIQMSRTNQTQTTIRKSVNDLHRTLLFVGSPDKLSDRYRDAIERNLPWTVTETVSDIADVCKQYSHSVSLILIDSAYTRIIEGYQREIARAHPLSTVAVLESGDVSTAMSIDVLSSKIVRGVIPANIKLEVWLSILSLLLRGGEYFPRAMLGRDVESRAIVAEVAPVKSATRRSLPNNNISLLTQRELEILKLVASGLQNKMIASTLHLSEHTVKIHVHNIITKLGAHNRTGASAFFRDSESMLEMQ